MATFFLLTGSTYVFEGWHDGTLLSAHDTSSDLGPALPKDDPVQDHMDGAWADPEVRAWLAILQGHAKKINAAHIIYQLLGPNSNSALRYIRNFA
jgi:hypothetical protein